MNDPASSSNSMRSRAVLRPLACWRAAARADPASTACALRRTRSASLPAVVWISGSMPPDPKGSVTAVWTDLERPPLREAALRRAMVTPAGPYAALDVVTTVPSTNTALVHRAGQGAPDRTVL